MDVRGVLAVFVLFTAAAEAADGNVEIWGETVTLTCPGNGIFYENGVKLITPTPEPDTEPQTNSKYEFKYDGNKNLFYCKYEEYSKEYFYYFYVKGKVCEHCFELDPNVFSLVIVVDVIGTAVVMIIIFKCSKKKGSTGPTHPKTSSRSGPAPPTPSRDYEQLNVHTRAQDTYSTVNRTG